MNSTHSSEGHFANSQWLATRANILAAGFASGRFGLAESVNFVEVFEREFARTLDRRGISWQYKPRTFAVEWDEHGNFVDSLTPAFYLPSRNLYLEIVRPDCRISLEKARKVRLLQQQYPATRIEVVNAESFYRTVEWLC